MSTENLDKQKIIARYVPGRDVKARQDRITVPCRVCHKHYYPGLPGDANRPKDKSGKVIRVSTADMQGFCSKRCENKFERSN